jgi:cytochrome b subunit of formate dehydrogenase
MTKIGIGVGEEFPVDEAAPPVPPENDDERRERRRRWRRHRILHLVTRVALIALIVSGIAWLLRPGFYTGPVGPYAFHPYTHHFFFPFFPILLIVLLFALVRRRHGCYGMHRHWHDHEHRGDRREEV